MADGDSGALKWIGIAATVAIGGIVASCMIEHGRTIAEEAGRLDPTVRLESQRAELAMMRESRRIGGSGGQQRGGVRAPSSATTTDSGKPILTKDALQRGRWHRCTQQVNGRDVSGWCPGRV